MPILCDPKQKCSGHLRMSTDGLRSVREHLPTINEAMSSIPSSAKTKQIKKYISKIQCFAIQHDIQLCICVYMCATDIYYVIHSSITLILR